MKFLAAVALTLAAVPAAAQPAVDRYAPESFDRTECTSQ